MPIEHSRIQNVDSYVEPNGGVYTGEKFKGQKHGYGKIRFADKSGYEGEWKNDKMHGKGVLYFPGGAKGYDGEFYEN